MHDLPRALETIAKENGVIFKYNIDVKNINDKNGSFDSITTDEGNFKFDYLISGADYHFTEQVLLPKTYRRYSSKYWDKRKMAPSSLIFYLGIDKKVEGLSHHNLFFDEDLFEHGKEIYDDPSWPKKPLFYVCAPSKTDDKVAPEGQENLFILMPIATDLEDSEATRKKYLDIILDRIEMRTGEKIKSNIIVNKSFCVSDFKNEYNSFKGNAYGLANTLGQTANLKPKMKSKLKNMYYCGQLTVPGPGIPPALISGKIAANQIIQS
jgi:phytoene desaturase